MNWPSSCSRVWLMRIVSLVMWSWTAPLSGAASSVLSTSKACAKYREGRESGDLSAQSARRGPVAGKPLPAGGCRLPPDEVACGQSGNDFRPSRRLAEKRRPLSLALRSSRGQWPIAAKSRASPLQQHINVEPGGGFRYPCALTKRGIPHARCHHLTRPVRRHLGRRDVFRLHGAAAGGGHSAGAVAAARSVGAGRRQFLPLGVGGGGDAAVQRLRYAIPILRRLGAHADLRPCDAGARLDDDANLRPCGVHLFSPAQAGSGGGGLEF